MPLLICSASPPGWAARPGTIGHATTLVDGAHVYIDAVLVDKIRAKVSPGYLVVHECFAPDDRLIVLTQPAPDLRLGQTVDVEGTITTLPSGRLAIINPTIYGYLDAQGRLLLHGPFKGFNSPIAWPWKTELAASSALIESAATAIPAEPDPAPDATPTYYPRISDILQASAAAQGASAQSQSIRLQSYYDGIPDVRVLPDGSLVELECKRILGVGPETIDGVVYKYVDIAEDLPAEDWIRTYYIQDVSATARVNRITGQIRHVGNDPVICVNAGPGYDPQLLVGILTTASAGTVAWAKTWPDGYVFNTQNGKVTGKVVTANQADFPGTLYVQEPSASGCFGGIRVRLSGTPPARNRGDIVTVEGTLGLGSDGEREITEAIVSVDTSGAVPHPVAMTSRSLGGGAFNTYTPGVSGYTGLAPLNNKGLLVTIWGTVTDVDTVNRCFYVYHGSSPEWADPPPVKVSWAWSGKADIVPPQVGWHVLVTGISSSDSAGNPVTYYRVLRIRDQDDLRVKSPQDTAPPTVAITNPPGDEIHMASGQTVVHLAGTATDGTGTGVGSVKVGFTTAAPPTEPTTWYPASYNTTTHAWTYDWQNPTAQWVWAKATDLAGNVGFESRNVTSVTTVTVKYVRPGGTGTGSSWADALGTVEAGLAAVSAGGEVWVAEGTYTVPTAPKTFTLVAGAGIYGGFSGNEATREQRSPRDHETILDGNRLGSVVTIPANAAADTIVDGFTIRNGVGTQSGSNVYGGGIYCSSGSPIINGNRIIWNVATDGDDTSFRQGGGIYCGAGAPVITCNVISGNEAYSGGGIRLAGGGSVSSNVITANGAANGGGVYASGGTILGNTFAGNDGREGGAIACTAQSVIKANIITYNCSGIYNLSGSPTTPVATYNCIYGNRFYDLRNVTDDPTNIHLDPKLAGSDQARLDALQSSANMRIQHDSPCVDAVTDGTLRNSTDIEGRLRSVGEYADIGAYESCGLDYGSESTVVRVDAATGSDSNDGSSWVSAMCTIQAAIDRAAITGGDVWVKGPRTFYERIFLRPFVYLIGSCSGSETARPNRVVLPSGSTVMDGQSSGRVVTIRGGYQTGLVDGFTITHGRVAGSGAGVFCSNSSPVIRYNQISSNTATNGIHYVSRGGGVYCYYGAPRIEGNYVGYLSSANANSANTGAGIGVEYSIATIVRNAIWYNTSGDRGGGIHADAAIAYGTLLIENNFVQGNSAPNSGCGICTFGSGGYPDALIVDYNTVTGNTSSYATSGGISLLVPQYARVADNIVSSNTSGIWKSGTPTLLTLQRNCVYGNGTDYASGISHPSDINVSPQLSSLWWLASGSPCRNNLADPGYTTTVDIDGQSRPKGGYYDIGCDEYNE